MKRIMVAVFDRALGAYMQPFAVPTPLSAIRAFKDEVLRPESELHKHPEDYYLQQLAEWDDVTGTFVMLDPTVLAKATEFGGGNVQE